MASEFDAMKAIDDALSVLNEEERARVLQWVGAKYGAPTQGAAASQITAVRGSGSSGSAGMKEVPGIARLTSDGTLKLTIRDLKAKNTNDAAIRLVHVAALANEWLTGEPSVSSKRIVVPALREWRAYTGNTRSAIAGHKGIIREGDSVSLDAHARKEAEEYVRQVQDESVQGSWKPAATSKGKGKGKG